MRSRGATNTVRKKELAAKYGVTPKKTPTQPQPQARAETTGQRAGPPQAAAQTTAKRMEEVANEERMIADNTAQKVVSTDLLGREVKEDIIGVDDNDEHKEGLRGIAEGLIAPTSQIAQMPKDILQGVAAEDQRMQTSWMDLVITPVIAPIISAPSLGYTDRGWYNPLAVLDRDEEWTKSLPDFLKKDPSAPEERDFITGVSDNIGTFVQATSDPRVQKLIMEGDTDKGIVGYRQASEEFWRYPGYYIASGVGEIPWLINPATSAKVSAQVTATVIRITNKPGLSPSFISATSRLDNASTQLNKVIVREVKDAAQPANAPIRSFGKDRTKILGDEDARLKIKVDLTSKSSDMKKINNAADAFDNFSKVEIKTRKNTIKELNKVKKKKDLTPEERDMIDDAIRVENKKIVDREAERVLLKKDLTAAKSDLINEEKAFNVAQTKWLKIKRGTKDPSSEQITNYQKSEASYRVAREEFLQTVARRIGTRLDHTKKNSYNKIKSGYNAYRDQELIRLKVKKSDLLKKKYGYVQKKMGLNKTQLEEVAALEKSIAKPINPDGKIGLPKTQEQLREGLSDSGLIGPLQPSIPVAPGQMRSVASTLSNPKGLQPDLVKLSDDIKMRDFIKKQESVLEETYIPGQVESQVGGLARMGTKDVLTPPTSSPAFPVRPTKTIETETPLRGYGPRPETVRKTRLDKKIDKLDNKITKLEQEMDELPAYEALAMTIEQLPYRQILPTKTAVAGAIVEKNEKKVVAIKKDSQGNPIKNEDGKPILEFTDAPMTTADKILSVLKAPKEVAGALYNREPQRIAKLLNDHLLVKNRVYMYDEARPDLAIPLKVGTTKAELQEKITEIRKLDEDIESYRTGAMKDEPARDDKGKPIEGLLFRDSKKFQDEYVKKRNDLQRSLIDNEHEAATLEFVPKTVRDEYGNEVRIVDPDELFKDPGYTPKLAIIDAAKPSVRVTESGKRGEWNIILGYEDDAVKFKQAVPDVIEGTAYKRPRKLLASKYEFGEDSFDTVKGKEYYFQLTVPEDSILGAGLAYRGRRHTESGPVLLSKGENLTDDLIDLLLLEPSPMTEAVGQSTVMYRSKRRLQRKKKIETAPKMYEGKAAYRMMNVGKFGKKYDDAYQKYVESLMTDESAGSVVIYHKGKDYGTIENLVKNRMLYQARGQEVFTGGMANITRNKVILMDEISEEQAKIAKLQSQVDGFDNSMQNRINDLEWQLASKERNLLIIKAGAKPQSQKKTDILDQDLTVDEYIAKYGFPPVPMKQTLTKEQYKDRYGFDPPQYREPDTSIKYYKVDATSEVNPFDPLKIQYETKYTRKSTPSEVEPDFIGPRRPSRQRPLTAQERTQLINREESEIYELKKVIIEYKKDSKEGKKLIVEKQKASEDLQQLLTAYNRQMAVNNQKRVKLQQEVDELKTVQESGPEAIINWSEKQPGKPWTRDSIDTKTRSDLDDTIAAAEAGFAEDLKTKQMEIRRMGFQMKQKREMGKLSDKEWDEWTTYYRDAEKLYNDPNYIDSAKQIDLESKISDIERAIEKLDLKASNPEKYGAFDATYELPLRNLLNDMELRLRLASAQKGKKGIEEIEALSRDELAQKIKSIQKEADNLGRERPSEQEQIKEVSKRMDNLFNLQTDKTKLAREYKMRDTQADEIAEREVNVKRLQKKLEQQGIAFDKVKAVSGEWEDFMKKWKEQPGVSTSTPRGRIIEFTETSLLKEGAKVVDESGNPLLERPMYTRLPDGQVIARGTVITEKGQDEIDTIVSNAKRRAYITEAQSKSMFEAFGKTGWESDTRAPIEILNVRSGLTYDEMNRINAIRKKETSEQYYIFENEEAMRNVDSIESLKPLTKEDAEKIDFGEKTSEVMKAVRSEKDLPREVNLTGLGRLELNVKRKVKLDRKGASDIIGMVKKSYEERIGTKIPRSVEMVEGKPKIRGKPVAVDVYSEPGINYSVVGGRSSTKRAYDEVSQSWITIESGATFGQTLGKMTRQSFSSSWGQRENREISRLLAATETDDIMGEVRAGSRTFTLYEVNPYVVDNTVYAQKSKGDKVLDNTIPEGQEGVELYDTLAGRMTQRQKDRFDALLVRQFLDFVAKKDGKPLTNKQMKALPNVTNVRDQVIAKLDPGTFRAPTAGEKKLYEGRLREKKSKAVYSDEDQTIVREFPKEMNIKIAEKQGIIDAEAAYRAVTGMTDNYARPRSPTKPDSTIRNAFKTFTKRLRRERDEGDAPDYYQYEYGSNAQTFEEFVLLQIRPGIDDGSIKIKDVERLLPNLVKDGKLIGTRPGRVSEAKIAMLEQESPAILTLANAKPENIKKYKGKRDDLREQIIDAKITAILNDFEPGITYPGERTGILDLDLTMGEGSAYLRRVKYSSDSISDTLQKQDDVSHAEYDIGFTGPKPKDVGRMNFTDEEISDSIMRLKQKGDVVETIDATAKVQETIRGIENIIQAKKLELANTDKEFRKLDSIPVGERTPTQKAEHMALLSARKEQQADLELNRSQLKTMRDSHIVFNLSEEGEKFKPNIPYDENWVGYNERNMRLDMQVETEAAFGGGIEMQSDWERINTGRLFEIRQLEREYDRVDSFLKGRGNIRGSRGDDVNLLKMESPRAPGKPGLRPGQQDEGPLTREVEIDGVNIRVNVIETELGMKVDFLSLQRARNEIAERGMLGEDEFGTALQRADTNPLDPNADKRLFNLYEVGKAGTFTKEEALRLEDEIIKALMDDSLQKPSSSLGRVEDDAFRVVVDTREKPVSTEQIYVDANEFVRANFGYGKKIERPEGRQNYIQNLKQARDDMAKQEEREKKLNRKLDEWNKKQLGRDNPIGVIEDKAKKEYYALQSQLLDTKGMIEQNKERIRGLEKDISKDHAAQVNARQAAIKTIDLQTPKASKKDVDAVPGTLQAYGVPSANIFQSAYAQEQPQDILKPVIKRDITVATPNLLTGISQGLESMTKPAFASAQTNVAFTQAQLERFTGQIGQQQAGMMGQTAQEGQRLLPGSLQDLVVKQSFRNRLREDERQIFQPVQDQFAIARTRNFERMPPPAPLQTTIPRNIPIGPGFIGPFWESPQERFLRQKRKKTKSKKLYWEVPEYWFQPGYWGGKDQMGPGYRVFKGKEPKSIRRKEKRKKLD